jgi:hypothetical protein
MSDLLQIQAQALHDARRQLEAVRLALGAPVGTDLADFAARLQVGAASTIAALSDYAVHAERCSWDTRGDAESVCDCGLEDTLKGARAHDTALSEREAYAARVAALEAERDAARLTIQKARQRLYDAHGRSGHEVYLVILAVGKILQEARETAAPDD